ncbi:hypothetical protein GCM10027598_59800 [Amycolatopsis oliviviridis]|uniref:Uncharacterized protein n=1 Tax=Amycolatopsis oliviviridis TaxID=1471590 RepID=A0ABQ3M170_9PSEU|nr:hypothetical protein GCM10017790_60450 [Amycolatopsis oliviviridis]
MIISFDSQGYPRRTSPNAHDWCCGERVFEVMTNDGEKATGPDENKRKTESDEREEVRGEQGTSSGDPHDDTDPQSG